ncbi:integrator complex subunit 9 [Anaeramoeba flamelloides]|uniref:Integrator complex subunit 9 n=1 Tax=Anaeramoeba flamelloides TaxID=1746091 RepID=A0ABQ8ZEW1_9EUKA|nr:integrator complex subunit 9 [Anaeramoeba flamelloides]
MLIRRLGPTTFLILIQSIEILVDPGVLLDSLLLFLPQYKSTSQQNESSRKTKESNFVKIENVPFMKENNQEIATPLFSDVDLKYVDLILITNTKGMYALPFITERTKFEGKILVTDAVAQIGKMGMRELLSISGEGSKYSSTSSTNKPTSNLSDLSKGGLNSKHNKQKKFSMSNSQKCWRNNEEEIDEYGFRDYVRYTEWKQMYTKEELDSCLNKIETVKYGEHNQILNTLTVSALSSGYELGSCNWIIETSFRKIVVVGPSTINFKQNPNFSLESQMKKKVIDLEKTLAKSKKNIEKEKSRNSFPNSSKMIHQEEQNKHDLEFRQKKDKEKKDLKSGQIKRKMKELNNYEDQGKNLSKKKSNFGRMSSLKEKSLASYDPFLSDLSNPSLSSSTSSSSSYSSSSSSLTSSSGSGSGSDSDSSTGSNYSSSSSSSSSSPSSSSSSASSELPSSSFSNSPTSDPVHSIPNSDFRKDPEKRKKIMSRKRKRHSKRIGKEIIYSGNDDENDSTRDNNHKKKKEKRNNKNKYSNKNKSKHKRNAKYKKKKKYKNDHLKKSISNNNDVEIKNYNDVEINGVKNDEDNNVLNKTKTVRFRKQLEITEEEEEEGEEKFDIKDNNNNFDILVKLTNSNNNIKVEQKWEQKLDQNQMEGKNVIDYKQRMEIDNEGGRERENKIEMGKKEEREREKERGEKEMEEKNEKNDEEKFNPKNNEMSNQVKDITEKTEPMLIEIEQNPIGEKNFVPLSHGEFLFSLNFGMNKTINQNSSNQTSVIQKIKKLKNLIEPQREVQTRLDHFLSFDLSSHLLNADLMIFNQVSQLRQDISLAEMSLRKLGIAVESTIKKGGNVLIPIRTRSLLCQIILYLNTVLSVSRRANIYLISPSASCFISYLNIASEWMNQTLQKKMFHREYPLPLSKLIKERKLKLITKLDSSRKDSIVNEPCVAFVAHATLRCGDALYLLEKWKNDPKNALMFLEPGLEPRRTVLPFVPFQIRVHVFPIEKGIDINGVANIVNATEPKLVVVPKEHTSINFPKELKLQSGKTVKINGIEIDRPIKIKSKQPYEYGLVSKELAQQIDFLKIGESFFCNLNCNYQIEDNNIILIKGEDNKIIKNRALFRTPTVKKILNEIEKLQFSERVWLKEQKNEIEGGIFTFEFEKTDPNFNKSKIIFNSITNETTIVAQNEFARTHLKTVILNSVEEL